MLVTGCSLASLLLIDILPKPQRFGLLFLQSKHFPIYPSWSQMIYLNSKLVCVTALLKTFQQFPFSWPKRHAYHPSSSLASSCLSLLAPAIPCELYELLGIFRATSYLLYVCEGGVSEMSFFLLSYLDTFYMYVQASPRE